MNMLEKFFGRRLPRGPTNLSDVFFKGTQVQGESHYHVYAAPSRAQALAFLRDKEVKEQAVFVIAETPDGSIGRDLTVIFEEKTGRILEFGKRKQLAQPQKSDTHCATCGHFLFPTKITPCVTYFLSIEELKEKGYGFKCGSCQAELCAYCIKLGVEGQIPACLLCGNTKAIYQAG